MAKSLYIPYLYRTVRIGDTVIVKGISHTVSDLVDCGYLDQPDSQPIGIDLSRHFSGSVHFWPFLEDITFSDEDDHASASEQTRPLKSKNAYLKEISERVNALSHRLSYAKSQEEHDVKVELYNMSGEIREFLEEC